MNSPENDNEKVYDVAIFLALFFYFAVNFISIAIGTTSLVRLGVIFDIFDFWIYYAPPSAVLLVITIQLGGKTFSWTAFSVFVVAVFFGAFVNFVFMAQAAASV